MIKKEDLKTCGNCRKINNCNNEIKTIGFYQERCKNYSLWQYDNMTKNERWNKEGKE